MSYSELNEYIQRQEKVGEKSLRVDLAKTRSVVFLVGLVVCFVYLAALRVSQNLGYTGVLSPFWAAWGPNILFTFIGLWFASRAEV